MPNSSWSVLVQLTCVWVCVCVMTTDKALTSCRHLSRGMNVPPHLSFPAGPMHPPSAAPLLLSVSLIHSSLCLSPPLQLLWSFFYHLTHLPLSQVITCLPFAWCASVAVWLKVKICHVAFVFFASRSHLHHRETLNTHSLKASSFKALKVPYCTRFRSPEFILDSRGKASHD